MLSAGGCPTGTFHVFPPSSDATTRPSIATRRRLLSRGWKATSRTFENGAGGVISTQSRYADCAATGKTDATPQSRVRPQRNVLIAYSPLAAVRFMGVTLNAFSRCEISPWMKRAVIGVPS
jgi:hypothetical protein